jgi:hypothetical protein
MFSYFFHPDDGGDTFLRNFGCYESQRRHIQEEGILLKFLRDCTTVKEQREVGLYSKVMAVGLSSDEIKSFLLWFSIEGAHDVRKIYPVVSHSRFSPIGQTQAAGYWSARTLIRVWMGGGGGGTEVIPKTLTF